MRSDGLPINAVPTVKGRVDGRALNLLDSHPDFDRSAFAWVGSEYISDGVYCASIYTGTSPDSPHMWIADVPEVIAKTGVRVTASRAELEGKEEFLICVFVGEAKGPALLATECGAETWLSRRFGCSTRRERYEAPRSRPVQLRNRQD